ncbi:MAG TPA: Spy/CpxP family protein refolding chaperone [Gemmatimonadaceae bacterium]|nr:Spy/CpxP family protein refolding chaperone [Gemmatimonadaceae bacterium]
MKRLILATALACSSAMMLGAQGPGPGRGFGPGPRGSGGGGGAVENPAEFLLSHTGELELTDAQVTRLAAIARRSAVRRQSLRTQLDSLRPQGVRGERPDSAARDRMRQRFEQMRPAMQRLRDQSQADRRDAIAVLTPDQQAQAWERVARQGRMDGGAGFRGNRMRGGTGMGGPGRMGMRGGPPGVGPRGRAGRPNDDGGPRPGGERRRPAPRPEAEDSTSP